MIQKELGRTGILIPELGIGTWNYHAGPLILRKGLDLGALFIDTAESYGTEPVVGDALRGIRDRVFLATKVSPKNFRSNDLRRSADRSLQRLGTDRIDLLQLHEPNPSIPIEETLGAMADLVDRGKVRFIGVSNFSLSQLQEAQKALHKYPIVSNQVRYNPIDRRIEKDLLGYCQSNGISIIAYSPLARGLGHIRDHDPNGVIESLVKETGKTAAQIILNWCVSKEAVVAVPGSNSGEHILDNCGASGWRLSQEQFALLDRKILHRERTRFEMFVKRHTPGALRALAVRAIDYLPRSLRRRLI